MKNSTIIAGLLIVGAIVIAVVLISAKSKKDQAALSNFSGVNPYNPPTATNVTTIRHATNTPAASQPAAPASNIPFLLQNPDTYQAPNVQTLNAIGLGALTA